MDPDLQHLYGLEWIITRIDGKIASVALDWKPLAWLSSKIAPWPSGRISDLHSTKIGTEELMVLSDGTVFDDLMLLGTPFQKKVWENLFYLTHRRPSADGSPQAPGQEAGNPPRLLSYTDFAQMCGSRAGVRAVAHAVGLNPIPVIIPCHLIVPKEATDRIARTEKEAESTLFGKDGLCLDPTLYFGEFSLPGGSSLKRDLILRQCGRP